MSRLHYSLESGAGAIKLDAFVDLAALLDCAGYAYCIDALYRQTSRNQSPDCTEFALSSSPARYAPICPDALLPEQSDKPGR